MNIIKPIIEAHLEALFPDEDLCYDDDGYGPCFGSDEENAEYPVCNSCGTRIDLQESPYCEDCRKNVTEE